MVVGNEGLDYAAIAYIPVDVVLYHPFSLQGQPRRSEHSLVSILAKAGINKDSCIGVVGHKYMENDEFGDPEQVSDLPSYLVDTFRGLVGKSGPEMSLSGLPSDHGRNSLTVVDRAAGHWMKVTTGSGLLSTL